MVILGITLQAIHGATSQSVLEEAKAHFQEQLLRKAAQKEADAAMDEEQKRCACACIMCIPLLELKLLHDLEIPYSRKYWRELNLAVEPKITIARILADLF